MVRIVVLAPRPSLPIETCKRQKRKWTQQVSSQARERSHQKTQGFGNFVFGGKKGGRTMGWDARARFSSRCSYLPPSHRFLGPTRK